MTDTRRDLVEVLATPVEASRFHGLGQGGTPLGERVGFMDYLEKQSFACACCGWWTPRGEEASGVHVLICRDCKG